MKQLRLVSDPALAAWLTESPTPFDRLVCFGPAVFEAYARVRFIPDPTSPDQEEADVTVPDGHLSDLAQTQVALHRLAGFTDAADDCCFCVWDGYSDVELPRVPERYFVDLPNRALRHRRYALFRGPLDAIDAFAHDFGAGQAVAPPAFVWPADLSWCFASDVDPHWAGVGADRFAVDALVADAVLDVAQARPDEPQPRYY